ARAATTAVLRSHAVSAARILWLRAAAAGCGSGCAGAEPARAAAAGVGAGSLAPPPVATDGWPARQSGPRAHRARSRRKTLGGVARGDACRLIIIVTK